VDGIEGELSVAGWITESDIQGINDGHEQ